MTLAGVAQDRVAPAVDHDVMLVRHDDGQVEVLFNLEQHARAGHGVLVHQCPLFVRQFAGLREDVERDLDLADVVQQARNSERPHVRRREAEKLGQRHRQHGDVHRVRGRVLVELLELQERHHDLPPAVHRDRERADDRFGLRQRNGPGR